MKVLFISRSTIFSVPGGDTVQMEFTAKELRNLGVEVDLLTFDKEIDYAQYDLLHFFNITRPAAILAHTTNSNLPYVVSTIFVQYDFYKILAPFSKMGVASRIFGLDGIEYLKTVMKHFLNKEKLDYLPFLWKGQQKSIKQVLTGAAAVLPNSQSELNRVVKEYGVQVYSQIIPNGIDLEKFGNYNNTQRIDNQLICVGQIEPRKNQLNLIKAIENLDVTLKIIGNPAPNHQNYYAKCKKLASKKVEFVPRVSQEKLVPFYLSSSIHVLPSWFETTGLSSLEAAYLGCKLVVSPNGDTFDYFGDLANYCSPSSVPSIHQAIVSSMKREYSGDLKKRIENEFNWKQTAKLTLECYHKIVKNR